MTVRSAIHIVLILLLTWLCVGEARASLFPDDAADAFPLTATLVADLTEVMRTGDREVAGVLSLKLPDGEQDFSVKVTPRGKSRQERCRFYPLWINFKKSELKTTIFSGQNKLKLVTHCSNSLSKRGYVGAEMLVYRLLNLMTDASFRVRAIRMTYQDTATDKKETHPAFFIEHKKNLAKRLNATVEDEQNPALSDLHPRLSAKLALFQYMVGNTDFSMVRGPDPAECCHNAVPLLLQDQPDKGIVSVPYDFDVTGFVNAPYAAPSPALSITKLTQRLYRGYCLHNAYLAEEISFFKNMQSEISREIASFNDLDGLRTKRLLKFIDGFFRTLDSERNQQSRLYKRCR